MTLTLIFQHNSDIWYWIVNLLTLTLDNNKTQKYCYTITMFIIFFKRNIVSSISCQRNTFLSISCQRNFFQYMAFLVWHMQIKLVQPNVMLDWISIKVKLYQLYSSPSVFKPKSSNVHNAGRVFPAAYQKLVYYWIHFNQTIVYCSAYSSYSPYLQKVNHIRVRQLCFFIM